MALNKRRDEGTARSYAISLFPGVLEGGADYLSPGSTPPEIRGNKGVLEVEDSLLGNKVEELRLSPSDIEDETHLLETVFYIHTGTIPV